jgi:N-(2-amino-2-carboxyethyl)-L-glutamate synthase
MIHRSIIGAIGNTPVVHLARLFADTGIEVFAKLEYLNPFGSAKDRVACYVIEQSMRRGLIGVGGRIIESSSGNMAIALAAVGPLYGLSVTCVVDPTIREMNVTLLRRLGATVEMVQERDEHGGYLETRLRRVREIVASDPEILWINQYTNELCWQAHSASTAREILDQADAPMDVLAVAVSTTATLLGVSRGLRPAWPHLRVMAVDAEGSAVFGGPARPRRLPGLGSSRPSALAGPGDVHDVVQVSEADALAGCEDLLRMEGILAGASSGAVISALRRRAPSLAPRTRVISLLPDRMERYLGSTPAGAHLA